MNDADLIRLVVVNIPNFIGFVVALVIQYKQNQMLIEFLRECNDHRNSTKVQVD